MMRIHHTFCMAVTEVTKHCFLLNEMPNPSLALCYEICESLVDSYSPKEFKMSINAAYVPFSYNSFKSASLAKSLLRRL